MFGVALSIKSRVRNCTPSLFNQVVDSEQTARVCAEIEDALEKVKRGEMSREDFETYKGEQKKRLAILTPHATFPKGRRLSEDAVPSGLSMYDIDHIPDPRGYFKSMIADRVGELGIVLAHVTPSTEGLRLFFVMPEGMSLEEAQRWMSEQLGDADYDGCVKDLARCSFVVPREYFLYLDEEELFSAERLNEKGKIKNEKLEVAAPLAHNSELKTQNSKEEARSYPDNFEGIPYTRIIAEYWRMTGGEPTIGARNDKLHKLACNLRAICENEEEWLLEVMPRLGITEKEIKGLIHSACKEPTKGSKLMEQIVKKLHAEGIEDEDTEENSDDVSAIQQPLLRKGLGRLPIGLRESLSGVPESMYLPVLCSVLPIAAAYADQVEVEYCDGNRQRLGLMSIIRGEQASGKSVCKKVVDVWKRQFDEEDAIARQREEEWKERKKGRKANEKAPDDPKVLIRTVPVTVSCSTLLKRFKNANGHCLYSFGEELDTLRKTNGAGSWSSKYDIYRLSFDNGEWGQDYNSDQAESGVVNVAYNWTMLGTDGAMRKCFKQDNIENGLSSRVMVAEMPDSSFAKMPKYGKRSADEETKIQEAVTRLRSYSGFIDTPRLRQAIEDWVEEKRVEAAKDIDRVKDVYRKRAAVIGFRCGVIHHLLASPTPLQLEGAPGKEQGKKTSPSRGRKEGAATIDFALMMAEYTLQQQISAFGEALQKEYVDAQSECQRYGANHSVFDQLTPTFTMDDLRALKRGDCSDKSLRVIVHRWRRDGWIDKIDAKHWQKNANK